MMPELQILWEAFRCTVQYPTSQIHLAGHAVAAGKLREQPLAVFITNSPVGRALRRNSKNPWIRRFTVQHQVAHSLRHQL